MPTSSPVVSPKHWEFVNLGRGAHAACPEMVQFFQDEMELGERVAYVFDEIASWGTGAYLIFNQMDQERGKA